MSMSKLEELKAIYADKTLEEKKELVHAIGIEITKRTLYLIQVCELTGADVQNLVLELIAEARDKQLAAQ